MRQWRQTGDLKKIFVILETPDDAAARDTRGLAVLKPDPAVALSPSAGPKPEMLLSGSPRQCGHEIFEDRKENSPDLISRCPSLITGSYRPLPRGAS